MTAASNSEARKRAAGIAASVPTAQEPAPTLGDAPGADSEALAALIGSLEDLIERLGDMNRARDTDPTGLAHWQGYDQAAHECATELTAIVSRFNKSASSWLADHDRQTAERAWAEGRESIALDLTKPLSATGMRPATPNPYSEEARRG